MTPTAFEDVIADAIQARRRLRLVYQRKADDVVSVHEVAPVDVRPGDTPRTANTTYVWAWCFAEDKLERHLLDRVLKAQKLEDGFDPEEILRRWPEGWPRPITWAVPRDW
jgi:predicted DNA-binding transcriptional regulator YafY